MWDLFSVKTKIVVELIGVNIEEAVVHGLVQVDLQASPRQRDNKKNSLSRQSKKQSLTGTGTVTK